MNPNSGHDSRSNPKYRPDPRGGQSLRMAKDAHQQRVGAVSAVQFLPRPVCACSGSPESGVDFVEPLCPLRMVTDLAPGQRMKISVPTAFIPPEKHARNPAIGSLVKKSVSLRELQSAQTEFGSQADAARNVSIRFFNARHGCHDRRTRGEYSTSSQGESVPRESVGIRFRHIHIRFWIGPLGRSHLSASISRRCGNF